MNILGLVQKLLGEARQGAGNVGRALNSINPLYPQPAVAPESLRPDTPNSNRWAPYAVNGKAAPVPDWFVKLPYEAPTAPIPQMLGLPDYTAQSQNTQQPLFRVDQPINNFPRVRTIPNASPLDIPRDSLPLFRA